MRAPSNPGRARKPRLLSTNNFLLVLGLAAVVTVYMMTQRAMDVDDIPLPSQPHLSLRQRIRNLSLPHHYLVVMAMFKNEAHILREWLDHYISQGVDHFLLIDNGSTDSFREAIKSYVDTAVVTLVTMPTSHFQAGAYNLYFKQHLLGRSKWVLTVDLDEFLYASNPDKSISDVLEQLDRRPDIEQIGQICVPWKMFGSNGYAKQPRCVVQSFTRRMASPVQDSRLWKCAARSEYVTELNVHQHETLGLALCPDGSLPAFTEDLSKESEIEKAIAEPCGEMALGAALLQLNHYPIQAMDYFMRVKATRGDNVQAEKDGVRGEDYFQMYDSLGNSTDDWGLAAIQNTTDEVCVGSEARAPVGIEKLVVLAKSKSPA